MTPRCGVPCSALGSRADAVYRSRFVFVLGPASRVRAVAAAPRGVSLRRRSNGVVLHTCHAILHAEPVPGSAPTTGRRAALPVLNLRKLLDKSQDLPALPQTPWRRRSVLIDKGLAGRACRTLLGRSRLGDSNGSG